MRRVLFAIALGVAAVGCANPDAARLRATSRGRYDAATGKLDEITFDKNKDGKIDTWVKMDGTRPVSAVIDSDEDGKVDRWEEYDQQGRLVRAGESRAKTGTPDMWAYMGPDGKPVRIEFLEPLNGKATVVRRDFYEAGVKVRDEEDTDGDGVMDRWERFEAGRLKTVEFDDNQHRDGKPSRRFTYDSAGALVSIETEPDGRGGYAKRVVPGTAKKTARNSRRRDRTERVQPDQRLIRASARSLGYVRMKGRRLDRFGVE